MKTLGYMSFHYESTVFLLFYLYYCFLVFINIQGKQRKMLIKRPAVNGTLQTICVIKHL